MTLAEEIFQAYGDPDVEIVVREASRAPVRSNPEGEPLSELSSAAGAVRAGLVTVGLGTLLLAGGCAWRTQDEAFGVYWDASRACEWQYLNLRVERIDPNGDLTVSGALDIPANLGAFRQCYRDGIRNAVLRRQQTGQPVPDTLNQDPAVEME